jgi:hypothetical protein
MVDPTEELRTRAEILHKRIAAGDADARARMRALAELRRADDAQVEAAASTVQRKHCLAIVAREAGFASWEHALRVLRGDASEHDFGTALYEGSTLNAWYIDYDVAREHLDQARGRDEEVFLLVYKRQFFVVERAFIEALGLDPADPDWRAIGHDWARPKNPSARPRLYAKRFAAMRKES